MKMLFWLLALVALFAILRLVRRLTMSARERALLSPYRPASSYGNVRDSSRDGYAGNGAGWAGDSGSSSGSDSGGGSGDCGGGDGGGGGGDGGGGGCD